MAIFQIFSTLIGKTQLGLSYVDDWQWENENAVSGIILRWREIEWTPVWKSLKPRRAEGNSNSTIAILNTANWLQSILLSNLQMSLPTCFQRYLRKLGIIWKFWKFIEVWQIIITLWKVRQRFCLLLMCSKIEPCFQKGLHRTLYALS